MIRVYKIVNGERRLMRFHPRDWKRIKDMPLSKGTSWELAPTVAPKAAPVRKKEEEPKIVYGVNLEWQILSAPDTLEGTMKAEDCRLVGSKKECEEFVEEHKPKNQETQPKLTHKQFKAKGKAFMAKELGVDKDDYTGTELADLMVEKQG